MTTTVSQEAVEVTQADLLTKAIGDIAAALMMAGKEDKIAEWTAPYVEVVNAMDEQSIRQSAEREEEERERKLRDVCDGIDADYMTSEKHHPGYVLIPTATFQAIIAARQALKETPDAG